MGIFVSLIKEIVNLGINKIRYEGNLSEIMLTNNISLADYCNNNIKKPECLLLLSSITKPYMVEGSEKEKEFYEYNDVKLQKHNETVDCIGFYAAFLNKSFCVSFCSDDFWKETKYKLTLEKQGKKTYKTVFGFSNSSQLYDDDFLEWSLDIPTKIPESNLLPTNKDIKLRDDHGKDKLEAFAKRLINCPYVESIINSLPYNPYSTGKKHKVCDDGKIEFILTDTDKGLGLVIQTTAKTKLQTTWLANYIEKKFK